MKVAWEEKGGIAPEADLHDSTRAPELPALHRTLRLHPNFIFPYPRPLLIRDVGFSLTLLAGAAHRALADAVAARIGVSVGVTSTVRFPDGELHVAVRDTLRGHDVFLMQPTAPPFEAQLLELLLLADACRRAGAARLTALMPYFGYARQDRRAGGREPVGARLVADMLAAGHIDRVVAVDLHTATLEAAFSMPLEHLSAVPALAEAERESMDDGVVVAPDLGAARLADRYGRFLDLPVAVVHKTRVSGAEVAVRAVTGDVRDRAPLIVDDMISTGATIAAAVAALINAGCRPAFCVIATHGLLVGDAPQRLARLGLRRLTVSDTVPAPRCPSDLPLRVVTIAPLLAEVVRRLHEDRSLADLLVHF
ncbi:MAG TPA: ribose-phosphate pyrophosphokinase [Gemmatimonadales bacterium]